LESLAVVSRRSRLLQPAEIARDHDEFHRETAIVLVLRPVPLGDGRKPQQHQQSAGSPAV
jgi:hypothetical protein